MGQNKHEKALLAMLLKIIRSAQVRPDQQVAINERLIWSAADLIDQLYPVEEPHEEVQRLRNRIGPYQTPLP